jgi:hypothetical protein
MRRNRTLHISITYGMEVLFSLSSVMGPLDSIGILWFGEDQRGTILKTCVCKEIGLRFLNFINYSTLNHEHKLGGLVYSIEESTNVHHLITITE